VGEPDSFVDQLASMRVFAAIADAGSLSAAARTLGLPLPSVSRRLAALERELGARLLSRSTRKQALTAAGARYLDACRRVFSELDAAKRSVEEDDRELRGSLAVTAPMLFGRLHVLPIVAEFLALHPRVDLRLTLADRNLELIEDAIDVAIRIGALPDSSLVAVRVASMRRITCASPNYLRERGVPETPEDLARHDCISFTQLASPERWSYPARRGSRSVAIRSRLTVTTAEAAVDAASAGLGVTRVLAYQAADAIAERKLVRILARFEPAALPVSVLRGEGREPRPSVRAFSALATERLRAALREPAEHSRGVSR
jgi:DNA-binding transcriptional LysR family regulator